MEHKLVLTKETKAFVEWRCPACQRHVRASFGGELELLHAGDASVNHGSASNFEGLQMDGPLAGSSVKN